MKWIIKPLKWSWNKLITLFKYIWNECKDWHTLLLLLIICIIFYFPVWGFIILGFITKNKWFYGIATAVFWAYVGPVPYWPICITITLAIKKPVKWLNKKIKEKKNIKWLL